MLPMGIFSSKIWVSPPSSRCVLSWSDHKIFYNGIHSCQYLRQKSRCFQSYLFQSFRLNCLGFTVVVYPLSSLKWIKMCNEMIRTWNWNMKQVSKGKLLVSTWDFWETDADLYTSKSSNEITIVIRASFIILSFSSSFRQRRSIIHIFDALTCL